MEQWYSTSLKPVPPYSFELSLRKPAGWWWSAPDETYENGVFRSVTRLDNELLGLRLQSTGTLRKPQIQCKIYARAKNGKLSVEKVHNMLGRALEADEDLADFYNLGTKDPILQDVVKDLYGMHMVGWPELFPSLILATTLQMAPMKRSNQMMDLLVSSFGQEVTFEGKTFHYWPSPQKIAGLRVEELKTKARLGYRAKHLVAIAKSITEGFPPMEELWQMEPGEAKKKLLTLSGIGDYSAELVMPRMGFPLDVWSSKIFNILFFGKLPENPRDVIPELKRVAEERWGYWRGYAFVYILNDLVNLSRRVGFDLTKI